MIFIQTDRRKESGQVILETLLVSCWFALLIYILHSFRPQLDQVQENAYEARDERLRMIEGE